MKKSKALQSICPFQMPYKLLSVSFCAAFLLAFPAAANPLLFNSDERQSNALEDFPKWNGMLERNQADAFEQEVESENNVISDDEIADEEGDTEVKYEAEDETEKNNSEIVRIKNYKAAKCVGSATTCKWKSFLNSIRSLPRMEQIERVNRYHNSQRYIQDLPNWGIRDYWATLLEFLKRDGDCEDYAIAKYMSLKHLGLDVDDMRIVVLKDENLGVMHSVLAVYQENKIYILDNQIKTMIEDKRIHHYTPIYSINEHSWWRHLPKR